MSKTEQTSSNDCLNGLSLPLPQLTTLTAYVAPPALGDMSTPLCYIWGAHITEKRETMPRAPVGNLGAGAFKNVRYEMQLWLYYAEFADDPNADSAFPVVIDAVMACLRNTQMGVTITDPVTGVQTTVKMIGEDMEVGYDPVEALEDQRMQLYEGLITVSVWELIQA